MVCDPEALTWPEDETVKIEASRVPGACFGLFAKRRLAANEFITTYPGRIVTASMADVNNPYLVALELDYYEKIGLKTTSGFELISLDLLRSRMTAENKSVQFPRQGTDHCNFLVPQPGDPNYGSRANDLAYQPNISFVEYYERVRALTNAVLVPCVHFSEGSYVLVNESPAALFSITHISPGTEISIEYGIPYWNRHHVMDYCPRESHPGDEDFVTSQLLSLWPEEDADEEWEWEWE